MKCKQISLLLLGSLLISSNLNAQTPDINNKGLLEIVTDHIEQQTQICNNKVSIVEEQLKDEHKKEKELLGEFTITFYCGCKECNGKWYGYPAKNGEPLQDNYTIAVDEDVIPLNTYVEIEGIGIRKASDTGSKIIGNRLDIYISDHQECLKKGKLENVKVYKVNKS